MIKLKLNKNLNASGGDINPAIVKRVSYIPERYSGPSYARMYWS